MRDAVGGSSSASTARNRTLPIKLTFGRLAAPAARERDCDIDITLKAQHKIVVTATIRAPSASRRLKIYKSFKDEPERSRILAALHTVIARDRPDLTRASMRQLNDRQWANLLVTGAAERGITVAPHQFWKNHQAVVPKDGSAPVSLLIEYNWTFERHDDCIHPDHHRFDNSTVEEEVQKIAEALKASANRIRLGPLMVGGEEA